MGNLGSRDHRGDFLPFRDLVFIEIEEDAFSSNLNCWKPVQRGFGQGRDLDATDAFGRAEACETSQCSNFAETFYRHNLIERAKELWRRILRNDPELWEMFVCTAT